GDQALLDYTNTFDKVDLSLNDLPVSTKEFSYHVSNIEKNLEKAVDRSINNIKAFHNHQTIPSYTHLGEHGEKLMQQVDPIESVAIYVPGGPGGDTPLISTLMMNAIPAQLAGCQRIVGFSPPTKNKSLNENLLYVFKTLGINEVYKVGGAQAISAAAYGTDTIKKCDMIVGPGNAYVTTAKKLVYGDVMIDGVFGPSEIVIIADESANPSYIASDLISQAEHAGDELSVLLTMNDFFAKKVEKEIEKLLIGLERRELIKSSLKQRGAIMLVDNIQQAIEISNQIAPEHLELSFANPQPHIQKCQAGAIFIGEFTPEPIGDYIAGTNHVLPTNGTARFASPLGVYNFLKRKNIIEYNQKAFDAYSDDAMTLAKAENLTAHLNSLNIRKKSK
nr:histidinol dehydrogenase [Gammaproteobacteria bacterium]